MCILPFVKRYLFKIDFSLSYNLFAMKNRRANKMLLRLKYKTFIGLVVIASILTTGVASFAETIQYTYDKVDRLTKVEYSDGTVIEYAYDPAGNRLQEKITTAAKSPMVITGQATQVKKSSAKLSGTVNPNGLSATARFEYGKNSGVYTRKTRAKTITGDSDVPVNRTIRGLLSGTKYYYRLAAENNAGASYGSELSFTTLSK